MNPTHDPQPAIDPAMLDRLVDGELSETERRELLTRLDQAPEAWRSCALAFLEAQCWKEGLRAMVREPEHARSASRSPAAARPDRQPSRPAARRPLLERAWRAGGTLVAMVACFLLALVAGTQFQELWRSPGARGPAYEKLAGSPSGSNEAGILAQPGGTQRGPGPATGGPEWRMVTLHPPGGARGDQGSIRLPAVEADHIDQSMLRPGSPLPDDVQQALERLGCQVRKNRQLIPVPMEDGRRLVVPVDQVEVHYVGNPAYQ